MTDPRGMHRRAGALVAGIIARIPPDRYADATPCSAWDVRAVINHMTNGNLRTAALITGDPVPGRDEYVLGDDPRATFGDSFDLTCEAFDRDGVMTRLLQAPFGEVPGAAVATMRTADLTVHAWDLAVATGQPRDLDPELAAFAEQALRRVTVPRGGGGPFAEAQPVPPGAGAADRLAAFSGRRVPPPA